MANLLTRRAIAFLLAFVLAALAVFAVFNYVRSVEEEANLAANRVPVYAAVLRVEPGTSGQDAIDAGAFEQRDVPQDILPTGFVDDLEEIRGRTVQEVILPGDLLVEDRFTGTGVDTIALAIPPAHQAVSFSVGVEPGVAGFVDEGDFVSIIAVADGSAADTGASDGGTDGSGDGTAAQQRSQYVLQDVEVLAIGRRSQAGNPAGSTAQDDSGRLLLTVAVTPDEAERLVYGVTNTTLWLTLPPDDERSPVTTSGVTDDDYFTLD